MGVCCCGVDVRPWRVRRDIGSRRMVYLPAKAAAGAQAYKKTCASCHGATLEGGMGPALVGKPFWQTYGGKKVSTLWSSVHTQMPMMAPNSIPGEKLRQHYGLSVAKKRRTRRSHATGRYGGFVEGSALEIVPHTFDSIDARRRVYLLRGPVVARSWKGIYRP